MGIKIDIKSIVYSSKQTAGQILWCRVTGLKDISCNIFKFFSFSLYV